MLDIKIVIISSFSLTAVILRTYLRFPETKSYESLGEILWETAGAGATAASLRTAIAKVRNEGYWFILLWW